MKHLILYFFLEASPKKKFFFVLPVTYFFLFSQDNRMDQQYFFYVFVQRKFSKNLNVSCHRRQNDLFSIKVYVSNGLAIHLSHDLTKIFTWKLMDFVSEK